MAKRTGPGTAGKDDVVVPCGEQQLSNSLLDNFLGATSWLSCRDW